MLILCLMSTRLRGTERKPLVVSIRVRDAASEIKAHQSAQTGEHHQHSDISTQRLSVQQHRSSGLDARDLRAALKAAEWELKHQRMFNVVSFFKLSLKALSHIISLSLMTFALLSFISFSSCWMLHCYSHSSNSFDSEELYLSTDRVSCSPSTGANKPSTTELSSLFAALT